jgi:hypothetical protein
MKLSEHYWNRYARLRERGFSHEMHLAIPLLELFFAQWNKERDVSVRRSKPSEKVEKCSATV